MHVFPLILAAALSEAPPPIYSVSDAQGRIEDSWSRVARRRDGPCEIEVRGNGLFFRIIVSGFAPGELGEFHLSNGNIRPVRYRFRSDENGEFSKIYVPFRPMRYGGVVSVNASGKDCGVSLSFPWQRARVRVH